MATNCHVEAFIGNNRDSSKVLTVEIKFIKKLQQDFAASELLRRPHMQAKGIYNLGSHADIFECSFLSKEEDIYKKTSDELI